MAQQENTLQDLLGIKAKREALGLTIKDAIALTRISAINLEAIESGNFSALPVPIYTRNFIKIYAHALGMDSQPILDSYESYLKSLKTPVQENVKEKAPEIKKRKEGKRIFLVKPVHYKKYIIASGIVIIIVAAIFILIQQSLEPEITVKKQEMVTPVLPPPATTPVVAPEQKEKTEQPVSAGTVNTAPVPPALPQQKSAIQLPPATQPSVLTAEKREPVAGPEESGNLLIKATEETWLRMKVDQNPPLEVLLKPGERIMRSGASFDMDIGNAGGITIKYKGKSLENLGKSGQVIHLRLPE